MNLTDAIDAAARTHWETWAAHPYPIVHPRRWDHLSDTERDEVRALVRPIVEAAAPWIAQDTLRDAAEHINAESDRMKRNIGPVLAQRNGHTFGTRALVALDLRTRADEIQAVTR